jgi:hypothetical protein
MNFFTASILMHSGTDPFVLLFLFLLGTVGAVLVAVCWTKFTDWVERTRCRNWPKVPAVIDLVSVAFIEDDSLIPAQKASFVDSCYKATLTYIYHYPEEQMGDYSRDFGDKEDAEAWANSYKGETVKVHVDPRDPTRSILREEDL